MIYVETSQRFHWITDDGAFIVDGTPSSKWELRGVFERAPFGRLGRFIPLSDLHTVTEWTFKNGKPRYVLCDRDHGTRRIWSADLYRIVTNATPPVRLA